MRRLVPYLDASRAIVHRDWVVFTSYRTQFFTQLAGTFLSLVLFYYLSQLIQVTSIGDSDAYFAYVVIGIVILQTLQSTMSIALALQGELVAGTFERILLSPFGPVAGALSMMLFPFVHSLISALAILVFSSLFFGLDVEWNSAGLAIPIAILGTGAFAAFGMMFAASAVVFKRVLGGMGLVLSGIALLSGLYFPIALLPGWAQLLSDAQPFTPAVNLLRHVLIGYPLATTAWVELLKVAGFVVVMLPVAIWLLSAALRVGQRSGTIIEY